MKKSIAVIGAGAWGIALAIHVARTNANVYLWSRKELPDPNTKTLSRLKNFPLPNNIQVHNSFPKRADLIFLAVPLQFIRSILPNINSLQCPIIVCCKGVEQQTLKFPSEIIEEFVPKQNIAILSGPNFAHEVAANLPTASVIASENIQMAQEISDEISTFNFRFYKNDDPIGVQIGGAAKNIFAIAAGAAIGAGLGENARASLITRGISELSRLSLGLGGSPRTLSGLAGLGDMILTCTGTSSRNYSLGIELGNGKKLDAILKERTVVTEGVTTTPALLKRAQNHHIDVPIIETVAAILSDKITIHQAKERLMSRPIPFE